MSDEKNPALTPLVDTNAYLSRWPFRRLPGDEAPVLIEKLRTAGVEQAWVGSFDGLFHRDLSAVNRELARVCREEASGLLVPFGAINPTLPGWRDDLVACHETHAMPGIRLHPNYHGYTLDQPVVAELLDLANERGLLTQICASMEDERTQPALGRVPHVDLTPLLARLDRAPGPRWMILNAFRGTKPALVDELAARGVTFDIATLEGIGGVGRLVERIGFERVVFGSCYPLYYFESAALKLVESLLAGVAARAIAAANARELLAQP